MKPSAGIRLELGDTILESTSAHASLITITDPVTGSIASILSDSPVAMLALAEVISLAAAKMLAQQNALREQGAAMREALAKNGGAS